MKIKAINDNGNMIKENLDPADAEALLSLGLIYCESGEGAESEFMPASDAMYIPYDQISWLRGVLYAYHKCPNSP